MAAELKNAVAVNAKLIQGRNGIFTVKVDGREVFNKDTLYRFPEPGEVVRLVRAR